MIRRNKNTEMGNFYDKQTINKTQRVGKEGRRRNLGRGRKIYFHISEDEVNY
jgi:hypothetical protein